APREVEADVFDLHAARVLRDRKLARVDPQSAAARKSGSREGGPAQLGDGRMVDDRPGSERTEEEDGGEHSSAEGDPEPSSRQPPSPRGHSRRLPDAVGRFAPGGGSRFHRSWLDRGDDPVLHGDRRLLPSSNGERNSRVRKPVIRSDARGRTMRRKSSCISLASAYRRSRSLASALARIGSKGASAGSSSLGGEGSVRWMASRVRTMFDLWKGFCPQSIS